MQLYMNYSKQRELILYAIKNSRCHPTAFEIYNELKPDNPALSLGTVYRNLKLLSTENKVIKLTTPSGPDRFDGNTEEHYHYHCISCGRVCDADDIKATDISKIFLNPKQKIVGYELNILCICDDCNKNNIDVG